MKKIFAINGSPRPLGNTKFLLDSFLNGADDNNAKATVYLSNEINIKNCTGCLRCNLIKRCSIKNDDWEDISRNILDSDIVVFASPVYFHHFPASAKAIIDRFRSFIKVQITEESIKHEPWVEWKKDFVLILSMGSSDEIDAKPIIDLFEYITKILGPNNKLHVITATRLAVNKQINMQSQELEDLYRKLHIPVKLAKPDSNLNKERLIECYKLGNKLSI
jgi:multimeric flavodoxin WrbA